MALTDEQRVAIMALALRDARTGRTRQIPEMIKSPEDIERVLAGMDMPFRELLMAAQQADERIAALGEAATPEMRRSAVHDAYAEAVRKNKARPGGNGAP